jgi:hypothetical protein
MSEKWAFDLIRVLEGYQQRMPDELSVGKSDALTVCIDNLKATCKDIQPRPNLGVMLTAPETKLWVVRTIFDEQIYQCSFDAILASRVFCTIIFPFISSLLKQIIRGSKETNFTIRDFLQIMHSKQAVIRPGTVESPLLPPINNRCVFCGCGGDCSRSWEVKRLSDTTVLEWQFDKACEGKIMKVVNIYNLMRFISTDATPFAVCNGYTALLAGLDPEGAYIEFMTLIANAEKLIQKARISSL